MIISGLFFFRLVYLAHLFHCPPHPPKNRLGARRILYKWMTIFKDEMIVIRCDSIVNIPTYLVLISLENLSLKYIQDTQGEKNRFG